MRAILRSARRLAVVFVVVVVPQTIAPPANAAETSASPPRTVPSPFAMVDPCDASVDTVDDTSYILVRNGPRRVELRWANRTCARPPTSRSAPGSWPDFWVRFSIDGWANGPGLDHRVFVYPAETGGGYVVEVRRSDETVTCRNRTYEDLGPTLVGTMSSIRFRFVCMGGRQPFRTRLLSFDGDEVPNLRFTPVITPA